MDEENSIRDALLLNKKSLEMKKTQLEKLTNDYYSDKLSAETYDSLSKGIRKDLEILEKKYRSYEEEYEDLQSETIISKDTIYQALENFDNLYETATNEEKKLLLRAIIKKIEVEPNRKDIKKITFWFDFDDALLLSKTGGTVP